MRLRSASREAGSAGADGRKVWLVRRKDTGTTYTVARQRDDAASAGGARGNGRGPVVMPTLSSLTSVSMVTERCLPLFHSVGVQVRAADCARVLNRLRQLGWTPGCSSVGIGQADVDVGIRLNCNWHASLVQSGAQEHDPCSPSSLYSYKDMGPIFVNVKQFGPACAVSACCVGECSA